MKRADVYVLLSGGIDSTAVLQFHLDEGSKVQAVHFDYGQPSRDAERHAVEVVSEYYKISVIYRSLGFSILETDGEYQCRNALLLLGAASQIKEDSYILSLGIHAESLYYDASGRFLRDIRTLFDGYYGGTIQVVAPFLEFTKADIFQFCLDSGVAVDLTFSCERQSSEHCGECPSCKDREILFEHRRNL